MNPRSFFAELKRRHIYKVAVAYAIVGWLLIQIATQVFPFFEIPNWGVRLIVLIIVIGFPIAAGGFSWIWFSLKNKQQSYRVISRLAVG